MITEETTKQITDGDDEPVTSKGGEARAASPKGEGSSDIKVGSPTDGSGITAERQE